MAHYAFLDDNNIVTEVIVGIDETELIEGKDTESWYAEFRGQVCKRTSYSGSYRKNYAGIGFKFDDPGLRNNSIVVSAIGGCTAIIPIVSKNLNDILGIIPSWYKVNDFISLSFIASA
jgi:hypothetical protein